MKVGMVCGWEDRMIMMMRRRRRRRGDGGGESGLGRTVEYAMLANLFHLRIFLPFFL